MNSAILTIPATPEDFTGFSLGAQVAAWMESYLVHGPGDIRGQRYKLDREKRGILRRAYEVNRPGTMTPEGRDIGGRRRFKRVGLSVRKGWAKTELAAAVTAIELTTHAPARFHHWAKEGETSADLANPWYCASGQPYAYATGEPVGVGVFDPFVPMVAYTEEQSEELAYSALRVMIEEGPLAPEFKCGSEQIIVIVDDRGLGKAKALAAEPNSTDGARTSFQVFDETHRMVLEKLVKAHQTMQGNIPKRMSADAWTLEITTSFEPGLGSVAEGTMEYAQAVVEGKVTDSRLFFYHRQAPDNIVLTRKGPSGEDVPDPVAMREAVLAASGPAAEWTDIDAIVELGLDPQTDKAYWERVWLNRPIQQSGQAFPMDRVDALVRVHFREEDPLGLKRPNPNGMIVNWTQIPDGWKSSPEQAPLWSPKPGEQVTLGFDGSLVRDTTAIVGTHISTGGQFLVAVWKNPGTEEGWKVPPDEVDRAVATCFDRWDVRRMYCDPPHWDAHVADWTAKYLHARGKLRGKPRVFEWWTNVPKRMAMSLKAYKSAMREGTWSFDGHPDFRAHLANARRYSIPILDEDGQNLYNIRKERPDSPRKIDIAMAGCLSWEAYRDAIEAGENLERRSKAAVSVM